jgi:hypothetical protein
MPGGGGVGFIETFEMTMTSIDPHTIPSSGEQLCERIEASSTLKKVAESFEGDGDFHVIGQEISASVDSRDYPVVECRICVRFDALPDSVSDIERGLWLRLRHLLERCEARTLAGESRSVGREAAAELLSKVG